MVATCQIEHLATLLQAWRGKKALVPPRLFPQLGIRTLPILQRLLGRLHAVCAVTYLVPRRPVIIETIRKAHLP